MEAATRIPIFEESALQQYLLQEVSMASPFDPHAASHASCKGPRGRTSIRCDSRRISRGLLGSRSLRYDEDTEDWNERSSNQAVDELAQSLLAGKGGGSDRVIVLY